MDAGSTSAGRLDRASFEIRRAVAACWRNGVSSTCSAGRLRCGSVSSYRCGKTTLCQLFAELQQKALRVINCHMMTEAADFLGRLAPASVDKRVSYAQVRNLGYLECDLLSFRSLDYYSSGGTDR